MSCKMNNIMFKPTEFGWVSPKTPPVNHNDVVVLLWLVFDETYHESIGYFENGKWYINEAYDDYEIQGWFPYPYTPHNH